MLFRSLVSCLILDNNFIGEMISEIFSWGFVRFPGLIFTLDLDGIIWLITVKLLFWVLGFLIAALFGLLAVSLGLVLSIFVYPFALAKNIRSGEKTIRGSRRRMSTVNPLKSTPSCVSDRGTIYRICPHCGDTVTTSVCSMCGKKNHLFD